MKAQKEVRGVLLEPGEEVYVLCSDRNLGIPIGVLWKAGPVTNERGDLTEEIFKSSTGGASWFLLAACHGR